MTEATSIATIFEDFAIDHTPDGWPAVQQKQLTEAALMLCNQHEAIKQLRECLIDCLDDSKQAVFDYVLNYGENWRPQRLVAMRKTVADAEQALADTEEFVK